MLYSNANKDAKELYYTNGNYPKTEKPKLQFISSTNKNVNNKSLTMYHHHVRIMDNGNNPSNKPLMSDRNRNKMSTLRLGVQKTLDHETESNKAASFHFKRAISCPPEINLHSPPVITVMAPDGSDVTDNEENDVIVHGAADDALLDGEVAALSATSSRHPDTSSYFNIDPQKSSASLSSSSSHTAAACSSSPSSSGGGGSISTFSDDDKNEIHAGHLYLMRNTGFVGRSPKTSRRSTNVAKPQHIASASATATHSNYISDTAKGKTLPWQASFSFPESKGCLKSSTSQKHSLTSHFDDLSLCQGQTQISHSENGNNPKTMSSQGPIEQRISCSNVFENKCVLSSKNDQEMVRNKQVPYTVCDNRKVQHSKIQKITESHQNTSQSPPSTPPMSRISMYLRVFRCNMEHFALMTRDKGVTSQPTYINLRRARVTVLSEGRGFSVIDGRSDSGGVLEFQVSETDSLQRWLDALTADTACPASPCPSPIPRSPTMPTLAESEEDEDEED